MATSVPTPACSRTRPELDQFLKDIKKGEVDFGTYFFTNAPGTRKHPLREELDDQVVRCLKCGCTIDEHSQGSPPGPTHIPQAVPTAADQELRLVDQEALMKAVQVLHLRMHEKRACMFVAQSDEKTSTKFREKHRAAFPQTDCVVCGYTATKRNECTQASYPTGKNSGPESVSMAHISPLSSKDHSNFLYLCGTKGWKNCCHDLFDCNMLAFVWKRRRTPQQWKVCVSEDFAFLRKLVDIPSKPHKTDLHARASMCYPLIGTTFTRSDVSDMNCVSSDKSRKCSDQSTDRTADDDTSATRSLNEDRKQAIEKSQRQRGDPTVPTLPASNNQKPSPDDAPDEHCECSEHHHLSVASVQRIPFLPRSVLDWAELEVDVDRISCGSACEVIRLFRLPPTEGVTNPSNLSTSAGCSIGSSTSSMSAKKAKLLEQGLPLASVNHLLNLTSEGQMERSREAWSAVRKVLRGSKLPTSQHSAAYAALVAKQ